MKNQNKTQFEYFELHGHQCIRYDSDNSGINGEPIGRVQYIGLSSKGDLTDGKIYDCIGLSFGKIRIIDDSGEPFYYSRKLSFKDGLAKFVVVEDKSPKNILTGFADGTISRTPFETEIEKDHIIYMEEVFLSKNSKGHVNKNSCEKMVFVKRTPEINKAEEERLKSFTKFLADEYQTELSILGMRPNQIKETIVLHERFIKDEEEKFAKAEKKDKRYSEKKIDKYKRILKHAHKTLAMRESESAE